MVFPEAVRQPGNDPDRQGSHWLVDGLELITEGFFMTDMDLRSAEKEFDGIYLCDRIPGFPDKGRHNISDRKNLVDFRLYDPGYMLPGAAPWQGLRPFSITVNRISSTTR
jgi:hypothetical protein